MKQINDDQALVTKAFLRETLKNELRHYATKADMDQLEVRIEDKLEIHRDQILTKMDQIIGELAQMREEREFERYDKDKLEKNVADHEERIIKLETKKTPSRH
ncbi:MAG: hypothetical protein H0W89_05265 [Candidatus Levybacteria bacterium]|nr:hypothetical protein [Candidatus Levybacteria bacterium]